MQDVFTLRRAYFRLGLLFLAFCLTMLLASLVTASVDSAADGKVLEMLLLGGGWSFFAGLALWMLLAYWLGFVKLDGDTMYLRSVLRRRTIVLNQVYRARWRPLPPSLKLFTPGGRATLWFDNFRPDQRVRLIQYFHERLASQAQEGWSEELERYTAEVETKVSAKERDRLFRTICRAAIVAGPVVGFGCGVILRLYANHLGVVDVRTWSGSLLLDWTTIGLLVSAAVLAALWIIKWGEKPERSNNGSSSRV
jgi:hypothetical protein